jgi:hypothetical protein
MAKLKWTVEFSVDETWVADGFILTDERALDMLSHDLGWANIGTELRAKVIKAPDPEKIAKLQGYKTVEACCERTLVVDKGIYQVGNGYRG